MKTAYQIEFDLRNIMYTHLSRMSFGFYDRVQSGQLISRANSDIRSVQMYLTFGPSIIVQCLVAVVAFAYMLYINVLLALVGMVAMPLIFVASVRMREHAVPGLLADPVPAGRRGHHRRREHQRRPGREVLRRRGQRGSTPWPERRSGCGGPTSRTRTSGPSSPRWCRTSPRSDWPW